MSLFGPKKVNAPATKHLIYRPIKASFNLSQKPELSRREFLDKLTIGSSPKPVFNSKGFTVDLTQMTQAAQNGQQLADAALAIADEYIWGVAGFGLFIRQGQKFVQFTHPEREPLSGEALDVNNPNSFFNYVARSKRTIYAPDIEFEKCKGFFQMPENASLYIEMDEKITLGAVEDVKSTGADVRSLAKHLPFHSWSLVLLPLIDNNEVIGMLAYSFRQFNIFCDEPGYFHGLSTLQYFQMIAHAASLTIAKFLSLGQKI